MFNMQASQEAVLWAITQFYRPGGLPAIVSDCLHFVPQMSGTRAWIFPKPFHNAEHYDAD
jgi:hypothetical protein